MGMPRLAQLVALTALVLALTARPAFAEVEASAAGAIMDNQITAATIDPATGLATISGTLICSAPTSVQVYAVVRQLRGLSDHFAEYAGGSSVACGTSPTTYHVQVKPTYESDRLVPGPASSNTWAEYCTVSGCFGMGTDSDLPLRPAR